jgi:dTDP-4-dehydrorhamnose reductase
MQVHEALDRLRPAILFHFAAFTNVDWCEDNEIATFKANVEGTRHLAEWAAKHDAMLVFMSTDSVFDGTRGKYRESDLPAPINVYARSKLEAEAVVRELSPKHLIIRANIYGWNARKKSSLAEWILARLEAGQTVPGFTDAIFAPLLVNTLTEVVLKLVAKELRGTWHAASRDAVSKFDFAVNIARQFGFNPALCEPALAARAAFRAPRPLNTSLDAGNLAAKYGLAFPTVAEDIARFKALRDQGYVAKLKHCCLSDA